MRLSVLLLLGLAACQDYEIKDHNEVIGNTDDGSAPDIEVTPTLVEFGDIEVGADVSPVETVTVANIGEAPLQISSYQLEDDSQPFSLSAIGTVLVEPGGSTTFTVTFEPLTAEDSSTRILIASDDPDEPEVPVELTGTGLAPIIAVSPETYDFGNPYIGCEQTLEVQISNAGNADLVVDDFSYVSASNDLDFDFDEAVNGAMPWTLSPGNYATVYVSYSPLDDYQDEGFLTITSNDPYRPEAQAYQSGTATLYGENLDTFEQPIQGLTDIIFALDWSCSMSDDIARVQANFSTFVTTLTGMDADYHVSVVTADTGCVAGSQAYIDNTMDAADQSAVFDAMVNGSYGSYTEMGFTLVEAATASSNTGPGDCNEDMLREDATLAIVGVTDEVEQSANDWSYYVTLFQDLKADPDDLVIHAIAGDYPSGCNGNEPGLGWYEASVATGGLFLSICATDWASHLEALAEGSAADLTSFELTQWPVPETIVVRVDGITTSTGWTYNSVDNTIDFDENSVPEGGSIIEVEYALYGDCEA